MPGKEEGVRPNEKSGLRRTASRFGREMWSARQTPKLRKRALGGEYNELGTEGAEK